MSPYLHPSSAPPGWVQLRPQREEVRLRCIDGRQSGCYVSVPGGSLGAFMWLLGAVERLLRRPLAAAEVAALFGAQRRVLGPFHAHTDAEALARLSIALERAGHSAPADPAALVKRPEPALQPWLLERLVQPEYVGCGHMAAMLSAPGAYGVRYALVAEALRAFHRAHWRGDAGTELAVLKGQHAERTVLTVDIDAPLDGDALVPAFCTDGEAPADRFVLNRAACRYVTGVLGPVATAYAGLQGRPSGAARAQRLVTALADRHARTTLQRLAPDLPHEHAVFTPEDAPTAPQAPDTPAGG